MLMVLHVTCQIWPFPLCNSYKNFHDIGQYKYVPFLLLFKLRLGSSADTPEIGDLVLSRLCPALSQVVGNGLKPFLNGFQMFGRVNVTVWKVAEISAEQGEFSKFYKDILDFTLWAGPYTWGSLLGFIYILNFTLWACTYTRVSMLYNGMLLYTFFISHFDQVPTRELSMTLSSNSRVTLALPAVLPSLRRFCSDFSSKFM